MATNLHIRDVPDEVHRTLTRRAAAGGKSLRQYTIEVLGAHCELPTIDEWLSDLGNGAPVEIEIDAADAVERARRADDAEVTGAAGR